MPTQLQQHLSEMIDTAVMLVVAAESDTEIHELEQVIICCNQLLASFVPPVESQRYERQSSGSKRSAVPLENCGSSSDLSAEKLHSSDLLQHVLQLGSST